MARHPKRKTQITRRSLAAATLGTALALSGCSSKTSDDNLVPIDSAQLAEWLSRTRSDYLVIDARPKDDWSAGHIPGARQMELPELNEDDPDPALADFKAIIVYGENPGSARARALAKRLLRAKYDDVYWLEGGYTQWTSQGRRIESRAPAQ